MEKSTTLKEIAYELNLSINTVSRALRDCDDVNKETKRRVIETAIKLGYMPMTQTQFIKRENKRNIALIVGDIQNFYFVINCRKISMYLNSKKDECSFIFINGEYVHSESIKQLISQRVDGIISLLPFDEESLTTCRLQKIPFVFLGVQKMIGYSDVVHYDVKNATDIVINYISNYHKSKEIIYLGFTGNHEDNNRYECLVNSLEKINRVGYNIARLNYLEDLSKVYELIKQNNGDVSIVCFSDFICYDTIDYLNNMMPNIRLIYPRLHLISFDALCEHQTGLIDITSINYDYDDGCREACEVLYKRMNNIEKEPETIILPVNLHIRRIK